MSNSTANNSNARDISIDYLRTTLTLMVVWHHSMLAYTTFAKFNPERYLTSTHPIVDSDRWLFLDYAQYFNDVFFMSLMFFVSGLFVWPSLQRHGVLGFLRERFLRLGLPFAIGVTFLMPVAYYGSWQLTGHDTGFIPYLRETFYATGWSPGPLWFVWVLLMFNAIVAAFRAGGLQLQTLDAFHRTAEKFPLLIGLVVMVIAGVLYLSMVANYGDRWVVLGRAPFAFQLPRIGLYSTWFAFGTIVGTAGIQRGFLAAQSSLVRHWRIWIAMAFVVFNLLVFVPRTLTAANTLTERQVDAIEAILWVVSCFASCFGFLALFRGAVQKRRGWMDSLTRSAYTIYIVHWLFLIWLQRALMGVSLHAGVKAVLVFGGSVTLSWIAAKALLALPGVRRVL